MVPRPRTTNRNSSQLGWLCGSCRAPGGSTVRPSTSLSERAVHLIDDGEVVVLQAHPTRRIQQLVGQRGGRQGDPQRAAQLEREEQVLLLQVDIRPRSLGHPSLEDERPAVAE